MKKPLLLFFIILPAFLFSQEVLTLMHYNLLMYGNYTSWCTSTNNPYIEKTANLKTVVDYIDPDILTVNELSDNTFYHEYIKDNVFNVNGINYFQMGNPANLGNSYIVNQIYYNSEKMQLHSYSVVQTNVRDIDIFKLYYISPDLKNTNDTIFLNCVVAHLKSGSYSENAAERALETELLINHLNAINASGNYLFLGDLNVYNNAEVAFQNLVSDLNEIRFLDPIDKMGSWHNNDYFADVHTQSTHTSGGCPSGGGMDDRFDFILASEEVLEGTHHIKYIQDSYKAVGQDGMRFNQSLISPPINNSVPPEVLTALYEMSDHLPIAMNILIGNDVGVNENKKSSFEISINNPVQHNLSIHIKVRQKEHLQIELASISGQILFSDALDISTSQTIDIPVEILNSGLYLLRIYNEDGIMKVKKVLKNSF